MSGLPFISSDRISKEVDLKANNNTFLELDTNLWKDYILSTQFYRTSKEKCKEVLKDYDIKSVARNLKNIYLGD